MKKKIARVLFVAFFGAGYVLHMQAEVQQPLDMTRLPNLSKGYTPGNIHATSSAGVASHQPHVSFLLERVFLAGCGAATLALIGVLVCRLRRQQGRI